MIAAKIKAVPIHRSFGEPCGLWAVLNSSRLNQPLGRTVREVAQSNAPWVQAEI